MHKSGFFRRFIYEWVPGYLFYCGLLAHFAIVLLVVASALKPAPRRKLERIGHALLEPLENSADCTSLFRGIPFDWESPQPFALPLEKPGGLHVQSVYKSLGLRGTTSNDHDIFQVAVELDIRDENGYRTAVQPLSQTFFEINKKDSIERCHVKLNEDRGFDCLLERGQSRSNGDCLLAVKDRDQCAALNGQFEGAEGCRIKANQPIPKRAATEAFARVETRRQSCERRGWYRTIACAEGGRRCRPTTLCRPGKGT